MKKIRRNFWLVLVSILLTNCAVQKASLDENVVAKQLHASDNKAVVYIVRPSALGFAVKFTVNIDGQYIGATGGKRFIYAILDPGKHLIVSHAENKEELEVNLEANKTYYIEQIPTMGIVMARNKLKLLDEAEGLEKLERCKLSADYVQ